MQATLRNPNINNKVIFVTEARACKAVQALGTSPHTRKCNRKPVEGFGQKLHGMTYILNGPLCCVLRIVYRTKRAAAEPKLICYQIKYGEGGLIEGGISGRFQDMRPKQWKNEVSNPYQLQF